MSKKLFCFALCAMLFALSIPAHAQQEGKVYRIGILISAAAGVATEPFLDGFRQGLRELGYVEGKNVVLEICFGEVKRDPCGRGLRWRPLEFFL